MKRNIVQKKFEAEILDLYTRLKKALPRIQEKYEADALETFVAQCVRDFPLGKNTGILFYGRSNNGWNSKNPLTMDELPEQLRRPFFNLIRHISEYFYPEEWNSHIAWSNVCKVVPMTSGNPNNTLWYAQYSFMVDLIKKEIDVLSPKVVVLITGNTNGPKWDAPLFENNNLKENKREEKEWSKDCTATLYKKDGRLYIVTDRPECKPIREHADCIIEMIERNM